MSTRPSLTRALDDAALEAAVARGAMLVFDFDGTLAPIVDRPEEARILPGAASSLAGLSRLCRVAIVTGRSVDDVRGRLGFQPWRIVGNHGGECPFQPERSMRLRRALDCLRAELSARKQRLGLLGVEVEDKGQSITLHYRRSRRLPEAIVALKECVAFARKRGIGVVGGKCVVNFLPAGAPDKGQAVRSLLVGSGARTILYAGDDVNDEPVFAAASHDWLTVKIGPAAGTRARFVVETPEVLAGALQRLLVIAKRAATAGATPGPAGAGTSGR